MKYHALFFSKIRKDVAKFVVIGALRADMLMNKTKNPDPYLHDFLIVLPHPRPDPNHGPHHSPASPPLWGFQY